MTTVKTALRRVGQFSGESKMPGTSFGTVAGSHCAVAADKPGSICGECYAQKGRYVFPSTIAAGHRRRDRWFAALKHPETRRLWREAQVKILTTRAVKTRRMVYHRWFPAGDLETIGQLEDVVAVAEATVGKVKHWLPTRAYGIVRQYRANGGTIPENLTIRFSALFVGAPGPRFEDVPDACASSVDDAQADYTCPAKRLWNGTCGPCRACWKRTIHTVSYPKH